jgi:hypothetical protein
MPYSPFEPSRNINRFLTFEVIIPNGVNQVTIPDQSQLHGMLINSIVFFPEEISKNSPTTRTSNITYDLATLVNVSFLKSSDNIIYNMPLLMISPYYQDAGNTFIREIFEPQEIDFSQSLINVTEEGGLGETRSITFGIFYTDLSKPPLTKRIVEAIKGKLKF